MGLTAGMAFGPALLAKAGLRRTSFLVGWIPAGCWLLMYTFLNFPTLIVSFLVMGKFHYSINSSMNLRGRFEFRSGGFLKTLF